MELLFIFPVIRIQMLLIDLGEVMQIEGAFWVDTFVYAEELPILFGDEGVSTVRAHEAEGRSNNLPSDECLATDFALVLSVTAIVIIEVVVWSATEGTDGILGNGFPVAPLDRSDGFAILPEVVLKEELPVLSDEGLDDGEPVSGELLVFRRVGIIEGPLFEGDVSANKIQEPADSFVLFLNYSE